MACRDCALRTPKFQRAQERWNDVTVSPKDGPSRRMSLSKLDEMMYTETIAHTASYDRCIVIELDSMDFAQMSCQTSRCGRGGYVPDED